MKRYITEHRSLKLALLLVALLSAKAAFSVQKPTPADSTVPCAVLEKFEGDVQLLDPSRTRLLITTAKSGISCGGWVSVTSGWAIIHHRDGFKVHAAEGSFLQISDPQSGDNPTGDHVLLYKGQIATYAGNGSGELKILTANGRARLSRGTAVVLFNQGEVETQLIALDHKATLENRFVPEKKIELKAGEASVLNFSSAKVLPRPPEAVHLADLKNKLIELRFHEKSQAEMLAIARERAERKFPADLSKSSGNGSQSRAPASAYSRHPDEPGQAELSQKIKNRWVGKVTGGMDQAVLFPSKKHKGRAPQGAMLESQVERKRLIEELGRIKPAE